MKHVPENYCPPFMSDERIHGVSDSELRIIRYEVRRLINIKASVIENLMEVSSKFKKRLYQAVEDWDEAAFKSGALKSEAEHEYDMAHVQFLLFEEGIPLGSSVPEHEISPAPECAPSLPRWTTDSMF